MSFKNYLKQLLSVVLTSSLALGIVMAIAIVASGGFSAGVDLTLEFARKDGLRMVPGVPLFFLLLFVVLSPISYGLSRLIFRKRSPDRDGAEE